MPFAMLRRSSGRLVLASALAATTAIIGGIVPASTAFAAKGGSTTASVDQARQRLDALGVEADKAVEAFNQASGALTTVTTRANAAKAAVAKAQARVDVARLAIRTLAASQYENGGTGPALALFLSKDPHAFIQQADLLRQVSRYQAASLADVVNANRALVAAQAGVNQALVGQQAAVARLAVRRAAVNKILSSQQGLLAQLEAQANQDAAAAASAVAERTQLVSQKASRAQVRAVQPAIARRSAVAAAAPAAPAAPAAAAPAASGRAAAALAFAYAQLGKAYVFGAAGMSHFDCSGLTMRAWGAAGVSLAHSAAAQQHEGRPVSMSQLQPGDLVFYGNPAYHVGIYVGGGRILDSPHTGAVVEVRAMWGPPSGAVRP